MLLFLVLAVNFNQFQILRSYTLSLKPPVFMCSWLYDREVTNATSSTEMHVSYISEWTTILWTPQITKIWLNLSQSAKFNYEMYCNSIHGMVCYFFIWNQEHANHKSYSDSFHYWERQSICAGYWHKAFLCIAFLSRNGWRKVTKVNSSDLWLPRVFHGRNSGVQCTFLSQSVCARCRQRHWQGLWMCAWEKGISRYTTRMSFFFNVAICSFFSRELFVATFLINSSNGAGIPSSLTPPLLNNGANYLAPLPSPVHLWCRLCASLSSFLPTKGADDASIPYDVRMAAGVKQTEMFQVCVGQLGIHLRHLHVCQECFSRV